MHRAVEEIPVVYVPGKIYERKVRKYRTPQSNDPAMSLILIKKNPERRTVPGFCRILVIDLLVIALLESIHATAGIQHLVLSGIKRVRGT